VRARELIIGRFTASIINHGIWVGRIRRHLRFRNGVVIESAQFGPNEEKARAAQSASCESQSSGLLWRIQKGQR
jgi:hypothetical protein